MHSVDVIFEKPFHSILALIFQKDFVGQNLSFLCLKMSMSELWIFNSITLTTVLLSF